MHCVDTTPKIDYAPTPACQGRVPWPSVREITGLPTMFSAHTSLNYSNFLHEQLWFATNISSITKTIDMSGMKKWSCLFTNSEEENKGFCFFSKPDFDTFTQIQGCVLVSQTVWPKIGYRDYKFANFHSQTMATDLHRYNFKKPVNFVDVPSGK